MCWSQILAHHSSTAFNSLRQSSINELHLEWNYYQPKPYSLSSLYLYSTDYLLRGSSSTNAPASALIHTFNGLTDFQLVSSFTLVPSSFSVHASINERTYTRAHRSLMPFPFSWSAPSINKRLPAWDCHSPMLQCPPRLKSATVVHHFAWSRKSLKLLSISHSVPPILRSSNTLV